MRGALRVAVGVVVVLTVACSEKSASPAPSPQCGPGTTRCGDACVALSADPANCGACGTACDPGQVCSAGECATTCAAPLETCDVGGVPTCVDTRHDPAHCGACAVACGAGQLCGPQGCAATCDAPLLGCEVGGASVCVDPRGDPGHCGGCGIACAAGQGCASGACVALCQAPESACGTGAGSYCANLFSDRANCGACGAPCGGDATCASGTCVAAACAGHVGLPGLPVAESGGGRAVMAAAGDLDGDGHPDLAMPSYDGGTVGIALNDGTGRFALAKVLSFAVHPERVAVGRLDGDGRADLVVLEYTYDPYFPTAAIEVVLDPAGAADVVQSFPLADYASLALADLDGDGHLDLVLGTVAGLTVRRGVGDGTFGAAEDYAQGAGTGAIAIGDLDHDGDLDVATAGLTTGAQVRWNDGTGDLATATTLYEGYGVVALAAGDVDGDGYADLALHLSSGSEALALGPSLAIEPVTPDSSGWLARVLLADVDGDGRDELFSADGGMRRVAWWRRGAQGAFEAQPSIPTGEGPNDLVAVDVDGDGDLDLVAARDYGSGASVLRNDGGRFPGATPVPAGYYGRGGLVLADLDLDGALDLAAVTDAYDWKLTVLFGRGDGTFGDAVRLPAGAYPRGIAAGDVDGDGLSDLALVREETGTLAITRNLGARSFAPQVETSLGATPAWVALRDLDGDGRADAIVGIAGAVKVFRSGPGGTLEAPVTVATVGSYDGAVADLDRDGRPDLVVVSADGLLGVVRGRGGLEFEAPRTRPAGCEWAFSLAVADLDGDPYPDVAVGCTKGAVAVFRDPGIGDAAPIVLASGHDPWGPNDVAAGDVDGDGLVDLVAAHGEGSIGLLRNLGAGAFAPEARFFGSWVADRVAVGDLDRDGRADVVSGADVYPSRCVP